MQDGGWKVIFGSGSKETATVSLENPWRWGPEGPEVLEVLEVSADNTRQETSKDGTVKVTSPNGHVVKTHPDGSSKETAPDDALIEITFGQPSGKPLVWPSGKPLVWPAIKTIQKPPSGSAAATHYEALDGTTIQANPDGSKLVNWKPGHCVEADEHYGATEWCMAVSPDGATKYMSKPSADAKWIQDSW